MEERRFPVILNAHLMQRKIQMRFVKLCVAMSSFAVLAACASTSAYVPARSVGDYGYYSSRISENRYRVVFNGRSSTSAGAVKDYALLRAAELTLQEGADWFQIVDRETEKTTTSAPSPSSGIHHERVVERDCGLLGCKTTTRPATTATVAVDARSSRAKVSSSLEIVIGKDPMPAEDGAYYDADKVASSLRASM